MRIILFFLLNPLSIHSQSTNILSQEYYFIGLDEKHKMIQKGDSIFDYGCYPTWLHCADQPSEKYKVDSIFSFLNTTFAVLEDLDALNYSTKELRPNRFRVYAFKNISDTTLLWLNYAGTMTKGEVNDLLINSESVEKRYFITFYSQKYLETLDLLQTLQSKHDINFIIRKFKKKWKRVNKDFFQNKTGDLHYGVPAEILNSVCIQYGFNPNGASEIINESKK